MAPCIRIREHCLLSCSTIAGPAKRASAGNRSRTYTGVSCQPPANQTGRVVRLASASDAAGFAAAIAFSDTALR